MTLPTPLVDTIKNPQDLRRLPKKAPRPVAVEPGAETIGAVAVTGGQLGAALGVVELTIALPYVLDALADRLIRDVGHHACRHKIPTERRDRVCSLRHRSGTRARREHGSLGAARSCRARRRRPD